LNEAKKTGPVYRPPTNRRQAHAHVVEQQRRCELRRHRSHRCDPDGILVDGKDLEAAREQEWEVASDDDSSADRVCPALAADI
jgi:hypothetical protein